MKYILFGNILLLQITQMLRKAALRMQRACFVSKASVDAHLQNSSTYVWTSCFSPRKSWNTSTYCYLQKRDDDSDRRSALRTAQKTIGEMMRDKEQSMD